MKKMLQLALIFSALLFTFSCSNNGSTVESTDPGDTLTDTWMVTGISAYDDADCSSDSQLFSYGGGGKSSRGAPNFINAATNEDCQNLEWFVSATADDSSIGADYEANSFCDGTEDLDVMMYFIIETSDTLSGAAAGNYTKTLYATKAETGLPHTKEYTTYGRFFTYGTNMVTQILGKLVNDDNGNDRFVKADENESDERSWTFSNAGGLTMTWVDENVVNGSCAGAQTDGLNDDINQPTDEATCLDPAGDGTGTAGTWTAGSNSDLTASCAMISFSQATDYQLRGCTDENALNYLGGDSNEFGITATEETGNCVYSVDEASQPCVKIAYELDEEGQYNEEQGKVTYQGIVDCLGMCQFEAATQWVGDGVCDGTGGTRAFGEYNCEAFDWDGWDCACATDCVAGKDGVSIDGNEISMVGEGNGGANSQDFTAGNCQTACNNEECGYDIGDLADDTTWDCCSADCIIKLSQSTACDAATNSACNIGACNFYRDAATDIGLCCDQTGPDAAPGTADDIDCSLYDAVNNPDGLGGNGECDEACNSGACNFDGGVCSDGVSTDEETCIAAGSCSDGVSASIGDCAANAGEWTAEEWTPDCP